MRASICPSSHPHPSDAAESSAVSRMAHANHYKSIRVDMRDFVLQITHL